MQEDVTPLEQPSNTEKVLQDFLDELRRAKNFSDVNIAAGAAQTDLLGIREPA